MTEDLPAPLKQTEKDRYYGDWTCPDCGMFNNRSRPRCRECAALCIGNDDSPKD